MHRTRNTTHAALLLSLVIVGGFGCGAESAPGPVERSAEREHAEAAEQPEQRRVGVLLVNHGSRSETWRQGLLDLESRVREPIEAGGLVEGVRTAFMEYTEPSIATQLRAFDEEGFTDIVLVPIFLTVSSHSFDDIPTIIGQKEDPHSMELLQVEGIDRYTPEARVQITEMLDFSDMLRRNILRRARALSTDPAEEGLVLIAYGDQTYEQEWTSLFNSVGAYVSENLGIAEHTHGWCGHLVHYDPDKTTEAINSVLENKARALVIPVLVAVDEMFQVRIIGGGIEAVENSNERVAYRPDSILPDENIDRWVVETTRAMATAIHEGTTPDVPLEDVHTPENDTETP